MSVSARASRAPGSMGYPDSLGHTARGRRERAADPPGTGRTTEVCRSKYRSRAIIALSVPSVQPLPQKPVAMNSRCACSPMNGSPSSVSTTWLIHRCCLVAMGSRPCRPAGRLPIVTRREPSRALRSGFSMRRDGPWQRKSVDMGLAVSCPSWFYAKGESHNSITSLLLVFMSSHPTRSNTPPTARNVRL